MTDSPSPSRREDRPEDHGSYVAPALASEPRGQPKASEPDVCNTIVTRAKWEPEHDRSGFMRAFDEIVTGPVDMVHIERMSDGQYWIGIYKGNHQQRVVLSTRGKLVARTEDDCDPTSHEALKENPENRRSKDS